MTIQELRTKRAELVKEARAILDKAEKVGRHNLSEEEDKAYNELMTKVDQLGRQIEREERQQALETELAASQGRATEGAAPDQPADRAVAERRAAFSRYLRGGLPSLPAADLRALQADSDPAGGYIVAPQEVVRDLIQAIDDLVFLRRMATTYQVTEAAGLGVPSLDADPADADWTSELATGSEDSSMAFGKREMRPYPLAKRIKVSNKLLRSSFLDAEALVRGRLAYKFGVSEEKAFLTGNGAQKPLGVFTASADGIPTTRDVSTGNLATSPTFDGLIEAKYSLKQQYWPRAQWIFHRDAVKLLAKIKDGEGQYVWRESVRAGEPDRLMGFPFNMSEFAPNTFTTGQYVGVLGDFKYYWIVDALAMQFQRLVELYAETNQVGIIGRMELDGMPVLAEAFVRVKLA